MRILIAKNKIMLPEGAAGIDCRQLRCGNGEVFI